MPQDVRPVLGVLNLAKLLYILFHPAEYVAWTEKQQGKGVW